MRIRLLPAACRAPWRERAAACLGAQRGDTLVEVMVAALLVALIATASLQGYGGVGHIAGDQRKRAAAASLAQQDAARLRGLTITQLSGSGGNQASTTTIDGTTYTVTSTTQFVSATSGNSACTTGPTTTNADEVQTTSTVTWAPNNDSRPPVIEHGAFTPAQGGSLVVTAADQTGSGISGVTATVTGPTTVTPLATDANGCSVFGGLAGGTYTVAFTAPPGSVDLMGFNPPATQTLAVIPTQTATARLVQVATPGAIAATSFTTTYGSPTPTVHATNPDTLIVSNTQLPSPGYRVFGTAGTHVASITTPTTVFPLAVPSSNKAYSVYPGVCSPGDTPPSPTQAVVTPGATNSVSSIPEPAMIVNVSQQGGTTTTNWDDQNAALVYAASGDWTHTSGSAGNYNNTESYANVAGDTMTVTFTGTGVQWLGSFSSSHGYADVYLDGSRVATNVDGAAGSGHQHVFYGVSGLTNTTHTLKVRVDGAHGVGSGNYVSIDEIIWTSTTTPGAPNVTLTDTGCSNTETTPATQIPTVSQGALISPGQPYGNYTVCADDGTNHNTATVANTNFAAGNPVTIDLTPGASGLTAGTCP